MQSLAQCFRIHQSHNSDSSFLGRNDLNPTSLTSQLPEWTVSFETGAVRSLYHAVKSSLMKFPTFYRIGKFITAFTRVHHHIFLS